MKKFLYLPITILLVITACGQQSIEGVLARYNEGTVPYVSADSLSVREGLLLDTRALEEYQVSHIRAAHWVGYKDFNLSDFRSKYPDTTTRVTVYCSVGVRSEDIGEKLQKAGYTNVRNLYGGIFAWKNQGYPVYDQDEQVTEKVHGYNRYWGRLLTKGEKVYKIPK